MPQCRQHVGEVSRTAATEPRTPTRLPVGTTVEGPQQRLVRADEPPPARTPQYGFDAGPFRIYPSADFALAFDDNVFATTTNRRSDLLGVLALAVVAESAGPSHAAVIQAHVDMSRYRDFTTENAVDFWFSAEGSYNFSLATRVFGGMLIKRDHEERDSPDAAFGFEPTKYWERRAYAGISHKAGPWLFRAGTTFHHYEFLDVDSTSGIINNSDRSRAQIENGVRVAYDLTRQWQIYVQGTHDLRRYDITVDDNGFRRNSNGFRIGLGTHFHAGPELEGDFFAGYMRQDYADGRFSNVSTPALAGNVRWQPFSGTLLSIWFDRSIEETTLFGSSSYVTTAVGGRVEQTIASGLTVTGRLGYVRSNFQDITRVDHDWEASIGARYAFVENFYVGADYRFQRRRSTTAAAEYDRNQVFVRLGAQY